MHEQNAITYRWLLATAFLFHKRHNAPQLWLARPSWRTNMLCLMRSRAFVSPSAFIAAVPTNSNKIYPFSTSWLIYLYRMSIYRVRAVWRGLSIASRAFWLSVWMNNGTPYKYPALAQIYAIYLMLRTVGVRLMNLILIVEIVTIVCFRLFQIIG